MRLLAAELLKLNRWSTWLLVGVTPAFQLLVAYVLVYYLAQLPTDDPEGQAARLAMETGLRTEFVVSSSLTMLATLGGALALVVGALLSAREYGWRTVSMLLTQGATRLDVFSGKLAALAIVMALMVALTFAASVAGSAFVAVQQGNQFENLPASGDFLSGIAAGLLIVGAWAALGYGLGYLLRSTGLAIGLGLVYALVIESIIAGFGSINETFEAISRWMLGTNGSSLAASFGPELPDEFGVVSIDPPLAGAVLAAYLLAALAIGAVAFVRRDVT